MAKHAPSPAPRKRASSFETLADYEARSLTHAPGRPELVEAPGHGNENCDRAGRVNRALAIAVGRRPSPQERGVVVRLHEQALAHFRSHPDEARQMAGTLPKPPGATDAELAAWSVVGRTLMNLDEFITRE